MINRMAWMGLVAAGLGAAPLTGAAQTGLMVVAHGADSTWNGRVREVAAQVRWRHGPVAIAFLMGGEMHTAGWDSAVTRLVRGGSKQIVAVPLLVSSFSSHYRQVEYYAGQRQTLEASLQRHNHATLVPPPVPITVTGALDSAEELTTAVLDRWRSLPGADRAAPLVLVAHGPNDEDEAVRWLAHLQTVVDEARRAGAPAAQVHLLRDDAPAEVRARAVAVMRDSISAMARAHGDSVVALPILISSGAITRVKIPLDLADLPVRYHALPAAPHPALARWITRVAEAALR